MRRVTLIILFVTIGFASQATDTNGIVRKVPSTMQFADIQLKFTDAARREIQKEVDALTKSPTYYDIKADRIKLYFPIIEKTLEENGVPGDLKYLAVQESALISDAVSSSDAVGFWQFKDFTGREVGLRIDRRVDERLNVISSTIGAAKYFKRSNFHFKNWIYSILAHMTGVSGAKKHINEGEFGASKMTIDRHTHWYVQRFLAHMIAFRDADKGMHSEGMVMDVFVKGGGLSLKEIAKKTKSDEIELKKYNKWLKSGTIPTDKPYAVMIPKKRGSSNFSGNSRTIVSNKRSAVKAYPSLLDNPQLAGTIFIKINGLPCILAKAEDNMEGLSTKSLLHIEKFAKFNDLVIGGKIEEGSVYYLKKKRRRGKAYFHTTQRNESLWDVSQKFGIRLKSLAKLNRMSIIDPLAPGRVLWLHDKRPSEVPVEIKELPMLRVDEAIPLKEIIRHRKEEKKINAYTTKTEEHSEQEVMTKDESSNAEMSIVKHTVQSGESLYAIARQFGVTVSDLVENNDLKDTILHVGQVLVVPVEKKGKAP